MDIISIYFVILVIASSLIYYLLNPKLRVLYLSLLSCGFIASLDLFLLLYVLLFSLINYYIGLKIPYSRFKRLFFRLGIFFNLFQIIGLKYANFTIDPIFDFLNINYSFIRLSDFLIPIGISYITLQGIGYLINVNLGWEKPEKRFTHFILYITYFPKFLSGPIERSNHFLPQLNKSHNDYRNIISGLKIAFWGFFKKLLIANHLAPFIYYIYSHTDSVGTGLTLLAIVVQPLYLYFDFSGYTDIAIGFSKVFGIELIPNFNRPFLAKNITSFWKRFHISLSSWFNDYVFKQVSFRYRKLKTFGAIIAIFLTWMLFGIWHGAGWNFMALGFVLALSIIYEYFTKEYRSRIFAKMPSFCRKWVGRFFTYVFYGWALTFFFSPDFSSTITLFGNLVVPNDTTMELNFSLIPLIFGLSVALLILIYETLYEDYKNSFGKIISFWHNQKILRIIVYYVIAILIISELSGNSDFVYEMF